MSTLEIEIWSDIACPWCYIGKRHLEGALAAFPKREEVRIHWRAYELDPNAPRESTDGTYAVRLAKKYRTTTDEAEKMIARVAEKAAHDGLLFDYAHIRPGNTFDAHRLLHLAATLAKQDAVKERFFRGYFCEGVAIGLPESLLRLAVDAGLPTERVEALLASDEFASEVRADEALAQTHGVSGVPFFLLAGRYAVSGAQPVEVLTEALKRAYIASQS